MKHIYLLIISLLAVFAASAKSTYISGKIYDRTTRSELVGAKIEVRYEGDSTIVKEFDGFTTFISGAIGTPDEITVKKAAFRKEIDTDSRALELTISCPDHNTEFITIPASNLKNEYDLGIIYLTRSPKELKELTVTASKVKFYHKGDTVVYNADAFLLAEGSMLDALIRQLPGVELKSNGQIYVNGEFVENLLLNGKDFFKNNREVMLDNLGAYMVKDIKVYRKSNDMDTFLGQNVTGSKQLVMDVKLKKDFMDTWIVNIAGGYGTSDRYLGRLFAMRFTPRSKIAVYGNTNNTNESRKPGDGVLDWSPSMMGTGTRKTTNGGLDYSYETFNNVWKLDGNVDVKYNDSKDATSVDRTNFYPTGYTYDYSHNKVHQKNFELFAIQGVSMTKKSISWWVAPRFYYKKWDTFGSDYMASFTAEQLDWSSDFISKLYSNTSSEAFKSLINRTISEDRWQGHFSSYHTQGGLGYKIPRSNNSLSLNLEHQVVTSHENHYNDYILNFREAPQQDVEAHRRFANFPDHNWKFKGDLAFATQFGKSAFFNLSYTYNHSDNRTNSTLYAYERYIAGIDNLLPSMTEASLMRPDPANSYSRTNINNSHTITPRFSFGNGKIMMDVALPLMVQDDFINYTRGNRNAQRSRTTLLFNQASESYFRLKIHKYFYYYIGFQAQMQAPDLLNMVDITDTSDPLLIQKGNPDLKNSFSQSTSVSFSYEKMNCSARIYGNFTSLHNALARGYSMDETTGVRTSQVYNVNGNRTWKAGARVYSPFGKKKNFTLSNDISGTFNRSADLIGVSERMNLNIVHRNSLNERLNLSYKISDYEIKAFAQVNYSHFTGDEANFVPFNTTELSYGLIGVLKLPANFGLSTDFTIYSRRGYADDALNTNNYVWNGRITYTMLKGKLIAAIDAYDILHDLSNVFYAVNAQGRTETFRTVLPRYAMLTLQWRFSSADKKKK